MNGMCCESLCVFHSVEEGCGCTSEIRKIEWDIGAFQVESISIISMEPTCPRCLGPLMHLAFFVMALWHPRPMSTALAVLSFYTFVLCVCSLHETSSVHLLSSFLYILHEPNHPMCPEESEMQKN